MTGLPHFRQFLLVGVILVLSPLVATFQTLSDETLRNLPSPGTDFDINNGILLAPILIPRVPGTEGSTKVLQHFVDFFRTQLPDWQLEFQNSTSTTPATGNTQVPFRNLIATRDPPWIRTGNAGRLALVAHYDSKLTPEGFIGATDSAAPCAMLLYAARSIDQGLTRKWTAMQANGQDEDGIEAEKGIQIILLDGEEAFVDWTATDSIYGARALAEAWENTKNPALSIFPSNITSISLFVLLDLLGSNDPPPQIPSYFKTTHWSYRAMASLEVRLRELGQFKSSPNYPGKRQEATREPLFLPDVDKEFFRAAHIGDDHVPFMARGVEVLHLIPSPFPHVWHTMNDDGAHLDMDTVEDWATLVMAFAAGWMELDGYLPRQSGGLRSDGKPANKDTFYPLSKRSEL